MDGLLLGQLGVAELAGTVGGDFARTALVGHDHEVVAGLRHFRQTLDFDRNRRTGGLDRLAVFVQHGAHAAIGRARQHHVAGLERTGLHQHGGHRAAALVQARFDHQALGQGIDRRLEFQHFGLQQHLLQQVVDAGAGLGGHRHERRIAAELFGHHVFGHQFALDALQVDAGLVDLVDRHDDGNTGRLGVLDGFLGLRHHAVVGRHHQDHDVGGLRATGTHGGERLVARGVEEGHHAARGFHVVGTDVLGNAAGFAGGHLGAADVVQQRGLAVVDVAHDGDHRCARQRLRPAGPAHRRR